MNPWLGIALILAALVVLICGLTLWRRYAQPHAEVTRKLVHIGMGLVALCLPWLFTHLWPIVVLAVIGTGGLLVLRLKAFRDGPGAVLGNVGRSWAGEVCFSAGIATLFALYLWDNEQRLVLYVVPLLLLAVADAAAALVGVRWGRRRYAAWGGSKSLEGSVAFLLASLPCSLIPLLMLTDLTALRASLMSALLSTLAMLLESLAGKGPDNFLLPVVGFLLMRRLLDWNEPALLVSLLVVALLTVALLLRYQATNAVTNLSSARNESMGGTASGS
jgi:phytol kinase